MPAQPFPANRRDLETLAAELAIAERDLAGRIANARSMLAVGRNERDPRFRCAAAKAQLAREYDQLQSLLRAPAAPLVHSRPHLDFPADDDLHAMEPLDFFRVLHREVVRLQRAVAEKLAEANTPKPEKADPGRRDPAARAVAAAYKLLKERRPVSVRAACLEAKVDRANLRKRYPDTVSFIENLAAPDGAPPNGAIDLRTGKLEAWDDPDD